MAGTQVIVNPNTKAHVEAFRNTILQTVKALTDTYSFTLEQINHVTLIFMPIKNNLLTRYRTDLMNKKELRQFINENFSYKTIIPVSVDVGYFGWKLRKIVTNGKLTDIASVDKVTLKHISYKEQIAIDDKLSNLSPKFKFFCIMLNGKDYILGTHILAAYCVRKVRLSTEEHIIEDITDTAFLTVMLKELVSNNNVLILNDNRVIEAYKNIKLSPIKNNNNKSFTKYPNIGVIDFETFLCNDDTYKIYSSGFKPYLDKNVTMYYIDDDAYSPHNINLCYTPLLN